MDQRLPRDISPTSYDVALTPDLVGLSFSGTVDIGATVIEPTATLVCNVADLALSDVRIDGEEVEFRLDAGTEQMFVDLGTTREPGPIRFSASFVGELNDQLRGFYRSTFVDDDGTEHTIATSQLQSTDARRVFPCWDEPDRKATFSITLNVNPEFVAVSNGGEVSRVERDDGLVSIRFAETMKMSTYLVAFVVGPLEVSPVRMAGSVPVRIVHRPGRGHLTTFALDVAVAALDYFEDYYGIAYPADKLDMIALPDFAMGAMENLGCITYREILLLVDPDSATQPELQNVTDVINHELAHMWFGDLVTMSWWNGIWLNEAFATFMEMKATDNFRPDWKRWTSFGISRSAAMDIDSLVTTRPIEFPVISPADAEGMFDLLTYEKGAAVVRMLEQWLGEDVFRNGIRQYLDTHLYANTETHDLWDALEQISGRPVRTAMESWIFQGGYPVLEISDDTLRQRRFTYSGQGEPATWTVPVQLRTTSDDVELIELADASAPLTTPASSVATFNHGGNGFYRVQLPDERLIEIGRSGTGQLDPVERFGLLDDAWSLTLAGEVSLRSFLGLLEGYRAETDVSVWQRIIGALGFMHHVADEPLLPDLANFVGHLIRDARARLGDAPQPCESDRDGQLRGTLLVAAGHLGADPGVALLARQIHDDVDADAELLAASVKVIAATGDKADFVDFRTRFAAATDPQSEMRYLYALPAFDNEEFITEVADMAFSGDIRTQNAPFVLGQALMNKHHGPLVWNRVASSWETVNELFPSEHDRAFAPRHPMAHRRHHGR